MQLVLMGSTLFFSDLAGIGIGNEYWVDEFHCIQNRIE